MSVFPGDMSIGWGFGLEPQPEQKTEEVYNGFMYVDTPLEEGESELTDSLLAVSELEQSVNDLTEQLRSLTLVVNTLVVCNENLERVVKNMLIASIEKEGETN